MKAMRTKLAKSMDAAGPSEVSAIAHRLHAVVDAIAELEKDGGDVASELRRRAAARIKGATVVEHPAVRGVPRDGGSRAR